MGKGSTTTKTKTSVEYTPEQRALQQALFSMSKPYLTSDIFAKLQQPYSGQFVAPMSAEEQRALKIMGDYSPINQNYDLSQDVLKKTLMGEYLPDAINSYYNPMKQEILKQGDEATTKLRQSANLGGMLMSTPRMGLESKLQADISNKLANVLANVYQSERERQLQAIPQATALSQVPINYAQQLLSAGSLPRQIEQAGLTSQYQDWLRQLQSYLTPVDVASRILATPTGQTTTQQQPANYSGLASLLLLPFLLPSQSLGTALFGIT